MVSGGMCESDMATILLSEASTAKEGVDLLLNIYNTVGAEERSGHADRRPERGLVR